MIYHGRIRKISPTKQIPASSIRDLLLDSPNGGHLIKPFWKAIHSWVQRNEDTTLKKLVQAVVPAKKSPLLVLLLSEVSEYSFHLLASFARTIY